MDLGPSYNLDSPDMNGATTAKYSMQLSLQDMLEVSVLLQTGCTFILLYI